MLNISRLPQKVEIKFWDIVISLLKAFGKAQEWIQKASLHGNISPMLDTFQWVFLGVCGLLIGFFMGYLAVFFL